MAASTLIHKTILPAQAQTFLKTKFEMSQGKQIIQIGILVAKWRANRPIFHPQTSMQMKHLVVSITQLKIKFSVEIAPLVSLISDLDDI